MNWSDEGVHEEDQPSLRRPRTRLPSPPPSPRLSFVVGDRTAYSVRTTRRSPRSSPSPPAGAGDSGGAAPTVEEIVTALRATGARPRLVGPSDPSTSSALIAGGSAAEKEEEDSEFSFPPAGAPLRIDAGHVLDRFAGAEMERNVKAKAEFLEVTFSAGGRDRTEEIKEELLINGKVLDLAGLERRLRRMEAVGELTWFTELCSDEGRPAPPVELFECAFRALQNARSDELHRGADSRRLWIGSVAVPEFFLCPVSKKVMENPVVITSGKTVDLAALQEWWSIHNHKRLCPVTGEVLMSSFFAPHVIIASCISLWRKSNGIASTDLTAAATDASPAISPEEQALFDEVTLLAHSPSCSTRAYEAILRLLEFVDGEERTPFLHLLGRSPGTIAKLACILPETCVDPDPELDDVVLEIIARAASYGPNKVVVGDDRYAIPVLIARTLLGPVPTRAKCAQILGLLADNYYNKIKIGELGAFSALVELLAVGDAGVKRTAAAALASLCEARENWSRFVREGVAGAAIGLMREHGLVDEARSILVKAYGFEFAMVEIMEALLSFHDDRACQEMADSLWTCFLRSKPGRRRRAAGFCSAASSSSKAPVGAETSSSSSSSSTSSEGSAEEPVDDGGSAGPAKKDVKTIVSWLQKRAYWPRTYGYRN